MQKKRNIRLASFLSVMIVITIVTYLLVQPNDSTGVDKSLFSIENTLDITKVTFEGQSNITLEVNSNRWVVNDAYEADPQRVSVLFAILKQVSVRREVAKVNEKQVDELMDEMGVKVSLYKDKDLIQSYFVTGDESKAMTYMKFPDEESYLVEIPGYKSYLAGIFQLDENGWRNPLVFDLNWANLASVSVNYPDHSENDISIRFDDRNLIMEDMPKADSTKLGDYIDDISLLYVNDYLSKTEFSDTLLNKIQAKILVKDIAENDFLLEILDKKSAKEYLVRIDSVDYGIMESSLVRKATKPKSYFAK